MHTLYTPSKSAEVLFKCSNHDFTIRSLPDVSLFQVQKAILVVGSGVFRDMFDVVSGDKGLIVTSGPDKPDEVLDIHEPSDLFLNFIRLLHGDLGALDAADRGSSSNEIPGQADIITLDSVDIVDSALPPPITKWSAPPVTVVPISLLLSLWDFLDKYDVPASPYQRVLELQFKLNAEQHPLDIYRLAHQLNLTSVAAHASQYLISRPMEQYTLAEVETYFPSAKAYHRLVLLHAHRKWKLKEILKAEEIFPHDYGFCPTHGPATKARWDKLKKDLEPRVTGVTNVPLEMEIMKGSVQACHKCNRACIMAIDMLKYKVDKVPKTFDRVPGTM
ncbi:hypothetical protein FRB95_008673 [Tulasnella sp. JGI-2019a]|nr:hypothetical protein FRB95_008673 [Tulasnella sp. JGI-2019a]